ncbi:MAG TPA: hypothetical protein PLJ27_18500 [Polyangiaceae bacterium]|jgi:hypothetical protein|nr:hypothetical protein [Polyangiaceae bacterium]HNZ22266.1 hypothetical protein [Polyangiaceae bacterium]HOD25506.1 hypothetical protein [Polyangiaceae bacterium]HOE47092.1 hypothetical protein [Polyangiaceae bacterium]HOG99935.1 hypothetical protein [Polyangiaceae bacterium]
MTKDSETMSDDKIEHLMAQWGFSNVKKPILPDERILAKVFEHFRELSKHPEIAAIVKRQSDGEITRKQMWDDMRAVAKEIDKANKK